MKSEFDEMLKSVKLSFTEEIEQLYSLISDNAKD